MLFLLLSTIRAETLDIYLKWEYPSQARFNIYRKYDNKWTKVGETTETFIKLANEQKLDYEYKVTAVVNNQESVGSSGVYLLSNKVRTPGGPRLLTGLQEPKKLKLIGIVKP